MSNEQYIIPALVKILRDDPELDALIGGQIDTTWNVDGQMPRVILSFTDDIDANWKMGVGQIDVDIFTRGNDIEEQQQIRRRIDYLFDGALIYTQETGNTLRIRQGSGQTVQEEDSQLSHWSAIFTTRYFRNQALTPAQEAT